MSDAEAPERIWLLPFDGEQRCWCEHPDPSGNGLEDEATEYIRADLVPAPSVTVKPLEWNPAGWQPNGKVAEFEAQAPFGMSYGLLAYADGSWAWLTDFMTERGFLGIQDRGLTLEQAKAAAQADYESRIVAAIQIGPHQVACALCEDHPKAPNNPCAICGRASPDVTIPKGHPDLNLAAWIDRRREQVGSWADYIIAEVGKLEQEVANLRSAAPGWRDIETAPHETLVILGWYEGDVWKREIALASAGERLPNGYSNRWWHGQATHWMPLPAPPSEGAPLPSMQYAARPDR